jgi:hypothetical protein
MALGKMFADIGLRPGGVYYWKIVPKWVEEKNRWEHEVLGWTDEDARNHPVCGFPAADVRWTMISTNWPANKAATYTELKSYKFPDDIERKLIELELDPADEEDVAVAAAATVARFDGAVDIV